MSKQPAHVFVTAGNLSRLACDVVIISTDAALTVERSWGALAEALPTAPEAFVSGAKRAFAADPAPGDSRWRVFANVGASPRARLDWFIEGGVDAVRCAAGLVARKAGAPRPLVAVPLFGSRMGGAESRTGKLVGKLLPALEKVATETGVDVALVLRTPETYAAVQSHRRKQPSASFDTYLRDLRAVGDALAEKAVRGDLVLFLGAGASIGGGLLTWANLLQALATDAGLGADELDEFKRLDALDQGRLVQLRLEERGQPLGQRIAERFNQHQLVPLTQALLASLPVDQVATTNYDQLFETASRDAERPCGVLPYRPDPSARRWLLKLHGCTSAPDQIVLTRDDYLRFATSRAALAGIVQALMLTRHMLFVGFSLDDDNFHRIVHDVRSTLAASKANAQRFGTALSFEERGLKRQLWSRDLDVVSVLSSTECDASRRLRILLDYVGMQSAGGTAHLLAQRYDGVLTRDEQRMREALRELISRLPGDRSTGPWATAAGRKLAQLLTDMGASE